MNPKPFKRVSRSRTPQTSIKFSFMNLEPLKSIDSKAQTSRILKDLIAFTLKNRGPKPQKHVSLKP